MLASLATAARLAPMTCNASSFPLNLSHTACGNLMPTPSDPMGQPIADAAACLSACCAKDQCTLWNFNPTVTPPCWTWLEPSAPGTCIKVAGWVGGGSRKLPPAPPAPPPGGPQSIRLPAAAPPASPLHHVEVNTTSPSGVVLSADSLSLLADGARIYPIAGEVHVGRLPASQWREALMRMKAGGLNWISVYLFWIYFQEAPGVPPDFEGRRDVAAFLRVADSIGLRVLLRVGPWCHGETRNGGHPDWVLTSCGRLRSTDPAYLSCVAPWYAAVAAQIKGLFWKDGGPIVAVQVDNESSDWKYLLALRSLAIEKGILPAFFMKTGWPAPEAGYPDRYPMLPLFGGCKPRRDPELEDTSTRELTA